MDAVGAEERPPLLAEDAVQQQTQHQRLAAGVGRQCGQDALRLVVRLLLGVGGLVDAAVAVAAAVRFAPVPGEM